MVGLASRLERDSDPNLGDIKIRYDQLLENRRYLELVSRATADDKNVTERIGLSLKQFSLV
jgi:hypothetical protein